VLRQLAAKKKREFMQSFIGRELDAITLTHYDGEYTEALTDNYLKLHVRGQQTSNQWMRVLVEAVQKDDMMGSNCCP
jgi:tRNA A37 methylthiotransferase MiaB